jgi:hypothetical protein
MLYEHTRPDQKEIDCTEEAAAYWSRVNGKRVRKP